MTRFCLIEGTPPNAGRTKTFLRKLRGSANDVLRTPILRDDILGLSRAIKAGDFNLNDPVLFIKHVNSEWKLWRTPLELAIDNGSSAEMVVYLLQQGAKITAPALKLAVHGALMDWVSARDSSEFANAEAIIQALSAAGANWQQAFYQAKSPLAEKHMTPLHVIEKLGELRAAEIGLTPDCVPREDTIKFTSVEEFEKEQAARRNAAALDQATAAAGSVGQKRRFWARKALPH